jgi:transposase
LQFQPWKINGVQLLPPSVLNYMAVDHLSRLIVSLVKDGLDLSAIERSCRSALGQSPFDPGLMGALLLHGYASSLYSPRRIARAAVERTDFMMIMAGGRPDFRAISGFRRRHLKALAGLFVQVLKPAGKAGLVKLGRVALDPSASLGAGGTKIKANASRHKAMSYDRMKKREVELPAEVDRWLAAAEAADAAEDAAHGAARGDEMPEWMADRAKRLARLREANAALEAEAKVAAEEEEARWRVAAEADHEPGAAGPGARCRRHLRACLRAGHSATSPVTRAES